MTIPTEIPNLILIGPPKTATTSLAWWLGSRPDIVVPTAKELYFLDRRWDRGFDWYRDQFVGWGPGLFAVEATPTYFAHPDAPHRATELGDARFVVTVRDPVARAWSHHCYNPLGTQRDDDPRPSFLDLVTHEIAAGAPDDGLLTHGRYAHHLARWAEHVGPDRLLVLTTEQIDSRPEWAFRQICRFMGAGEMPIPKSVGSRRNSSHRLRSRKVWLLMLRWRLYKRLPFKLGFALDKLNRAPVANPPLPPDAAATLRQYYASDLTRLQAEWLGEELPASWMATEPA